MSLGAAAAGDITATADGGEEDEEKKVNDKKPKLYRAPQF